MLHIHPKISSQFSQIASYCSRLYWYKKLQEFSRKLHLLKKTLMLLYHRCYWERSKAYLSQGRRRQVTSRPLPMSQLITGTSSARLSPTVTSSTPQVGGTSNVATYPRLRNHLGKPIRPTPSLAPTVRLPVGKVQRGGFGLRCGLGFGVKTQGPTS